MTLLCHWQSKKADTAYSRHVDYRVGAGAVLRVPTLEHQFQSGTELHVHSLDGSLSPDYRVPIERFRVCSQDQEDTK